MRRSRCRDYADRKLSLPNIFGKGLEDAVLGCDGVSIDGKGVVVMRGTSQSVLDFVGSNFGVSVFLCRQ